MTACGAALRRLGTDATCLEQVADRLVRHLYRSLTMGHFREPACSLVRLFKTTPYSRLTPDLRALADIRLGDKPPPPSLTCLTLLASAGAVPGWNDPTRSSRFRVIPLDTLEAVERLPMFSQLFRQLGVSLPSLTQSGASVLLDQHEQSFNVFHIPEAEGSPYVPAQEEFVLKYGIRSVLGFGAPLLDGELFSIILFSKDFIPQSTAALFKPLALCAQIALAPYATTMAPSHPHHTSMPDRADVAPTPVHDAHLRARIADLERLLTVHEQTVDEQADRMELIVQGSQMGTWDWEIPTGRVTFNERWANMLGYRLDELEPHVRTWEQLVHPDDLHQVMATVSAHLRGDTPTYSSEYRLRRKSGAWCWVFDSGRVVKRDNKGIAVRAAGIHLDISDRKELEAAQARAQCDLHAKQQALDEAQTLAHLGSWHWNIATGQEEWSEEQCRIFGHTPGRCRPTYATFLSALHPDDVERVKQAVDEALTYDSPYNLDCRIHRPDGEVRHINCRGVVHRDRDGRPVSMAGTVLDITDYKRTEFAWRDSETRMRSIFESAIEGIVVIDERGRIESTNTALLNLLGYQAHELIGQNISILMPSPYREQHDGYLANCLVTGKPIIGSGREVPAVRKDGTLIDVHVSVSEMQIGTERKYTGMLRDVSERKQMEETLRESEERFRQLTEHIDAVFWLTSHDKGDVLYVSPTFETVWECPRDLLYANPGVWLDRVHPEDRKRVITAAACQAHLPYDEEYRIVTPSGQVRWIRDRSFAIKNAKGETYRIAGIAVDITLPKQMEAQIRASELRHRALVELSPHAIFVNCEDRIVFANQACAKLLGVIAPSQLFGKTVLEFIHPESHPRVQQRIAAIRATNQSLPLRGAVHRCPRLDHRCGSSGSPDHVRGETGHPGHCHRYPGSQRPGTGPTGDQPATAHHPCQRD